MEVSAQPRRNIATDKSSHLSFLDNIFEKLQQTGDITVLRELRDGDNTEVTGSELLRQVAAARGFLRSRGLQKGDRCVLVAPNSVRWVALDLAIMAEELIVVPLYFRQSAGELVAMMKDCSPGLIVAGDPVLGDSMREAWKDSPPSCLLDSVFEPQPRQKDPLPMVQCGPISGSEPVTIIYTSGTSGDAKGVVLTAANVGHMLGCTSERLDLLMAGKEGQDRVYHYLPFNFAGSWIMLLTCLLRGSLLALNSDLGKIAGEMRGAGPDYFLNVPALLERMRRAVDEQLWKTGGAALAIYSRAKAAWMRRQEGNSRLADALWLAAANTVVFPAIRGKMIGRNLKALICGSAPLSVETQLFFKMLSIPVLQVYGLTETTAICTMDDPRQVTPGRVGPAITGIEMKLGENGEILVRGPHIFPGYWNRPEETAKVMSEEWFHTGDQGEVDASGNWKIAGRIKNLIILGSGHNIAPEPIEEKLLQIMPGAQQVVLVGNGRGYLSALVTGEITEERIQAALDQVNPTLPHYRQVRAFHFLPQPFSIENGLLTANGKLKRDAIMRRYAAEVEAMYASRTGAVV